MADPQIYDLARTSDQTLDSEEGLQTAITLSLFSNARALPDDVLVDPTDRKGWWGDTYADNPGDSFGSRLWQLQGQPISTELLTTMDQMIHEALQWMVDDRLISGVDVELSQVRHGVIGATIGVLRPQNGTVQPLGTWEISLNVV
jgi:phage gp46-like protein